MEAAAGRTGGREHSGVQRHDLTRAALGLEVALETVCQKLPSGGDHETRQRVAEALLRGGQ